MDTFKENFPELFNHILTYLHPIDRVALSLTSTYYAQYYPTEFAQWRHNILPINKFINTIIHRIEPQINPNEWHDFRISFHFPIHAGCSTMIFSDKHVSYAYSGDSKHVELRGVSYHKNIHIVSFRIPDNGKAEYLIRNLI